MATTTRIRKRKDGRCSWCGQAIEVGSAFVWWPSVNGDGVPNGSCSLHPECDEAFRMNGTDQFAKYEHGRGDYHDRIA